MSITAKEIAKILNISAAAVSMALNNKPGVSTATRQLVLETAEKYGYDFSKISRAAHLEGEIYFLKCQSRFTTIYTSIYDELMFGIKEECTKENLKLVIDPFPIDENNVEKRMEELRLSHCAGIILLATLATKELCKTFLSLPFPVVLLDSYFSELRCNSVVINNEEGAHLATDYLLSKHHFQPGHLRASLMIPNFLARRQGFLRSVQEHGYSRSNCITHELTPTMEGAMADMMEILSNQEPLAKCYFADNDIIAIGAIKALKIKGYHIPNDIAIIGFDNTFESKIVDPSLTTMNVPRQYMGRLAMRQLISAIREPVPYFAKTAILPTLVKRFSV